MIGKTSVLTAIGFLAVAAFVSPEISASVNSGPRHILSVGCHIVDTTCFVQLDGPVVGPPSCSSNSIRWASDGPNGKEQLAMMLSAQARGQTISLEISDTCYAAQPTFPTFLWGNYD